MPLVNLTEDNFDELIESHELVLLDFWAEWCAPCKGFAPIYEAAALEHPDILFAKIDVDSQAQLAQQFEVKSIPTLLAAKSGTVVEVRLGSLNPAGLEALIAKVRQAQVEP